MKKTIAGGVWPVMITPFTEDNRIDYDAVLRIIEWYDKNGVDGIFAVCQSSEMFELSPQERVELAKFIINNTPKHMGVIASGHCAEKVEDQIREAQTVIDAGVDAYVFISNQFAKEYKRLLSPELLKWCAETEKFAFLKDTCCDLDQLEAKCKAVEGTGLKIFNANAATLLRSMEMGCAGYSGVMANFHPDLYVWLCKNYKEQPEKAQELMNFLGAASMVECQVYPVNSKYHMNLVGVPMTLQSRRQDYKLLTGSKKLEIEEFCAITETFRKSFFGK